MENSVVATLAIAPASGVESECPRRVRTNQAQGTMSNVYTLGLNSRGDEVRRVRLAFNSVYGFRKRSMVTLIIIV